MDAAHSQPPNFLLLDFASTLSSQLFHHTSTTAKPSTMSYNSTFSLPPVWEATPDEYMALVAAPLDPAKATTDDCAICKEAWGANLSAKESDAGVVTDCGHEFHKACLHLWVATPLDTMDYSNCCPLCREILFEHPLPPPLYSQEETDFATEILMKDEQRLIDSARIWGRVELVKRRIYVKSSRTYEIDWEEVIYKCYDQYRDTGIWTRRKEDALRKAENYPVLVLARTLLHMVEEEGLQSEYLRTIVAVCMSDDWKERVGDEVWEDDEDW